ncbi:acyl dehydratase [Streptomyces sp. NPDC096311]|uniref:acyl dehydratase n=1 Tax=Streptomyces sp. NPDC096311 TaxID=3366083 RepID=UPI003812EB13
MSTARTSEVRVGDQIPAVAFPLPVYRMVMAAGANRDFNSIHHNTAHARATGAPDMYANTLFLMGMWERAARDWAGPDGRFVAIRGFRMRSFNTAGSTATVRGRVTAVDERSGLVTLSLRTEDSDGATTVGPGEVDVRLPVSGRKAPHDSMRG